MDPDDIPVSLLWCRYVLVTHALSVVALSRVLCLSASDLEWYRDVLQMSLADKAITPDEDALLSAVRCKQQLSDAYQAVIAPQCLFAQLYHCCLFAFLLGMLSCCSQIEDQRSAA